MAQIRFQDVTRHFAGAADPAVTSVDLDIADGESVAFVGPPGAGKTTLLRLAGGLEVPDRGQITVGDQDGAGGTAEVVMLFQNYAIYPHLSVRDNIASPLRATRSPGDAEGDLDEVIRLLGLDDLEKRPASSLSASDRMRVALARSLARRPGVLLMDEPLANLEPGVRQDLRDRLVSAQRAFGVTTLYATEDPQEATAVADRVLRVEGGRVLVEGEGHPDPTGSP